MFISSVVTVYRVARISAGSQANKVVCRGAVDDLKLALVTLAASTAVEAAQSENIVGLLHADLGPTADRFSSKRPFQVIFSTKNNFPSKEMNFLRHLERYFSKRRWPLILCMYLHTFFSLFTNY